MKSFFLFLLLLFNAAVLYSQADDQAALKKVVNDFVLAIKNNDVAVAEPLLADDYKLYGGLICIRNKEDRVASLKAGQIKYQLINSDAVKNFSINQYGAGITLYALLKYTACNEDGKEITIENCPVLFHFIKQGDNWRIDSECLGGGCLH